MRTVLMVAVLAAAAVPAGAQERLADQVRKGIVEEEVNRNLDKAIQSYQAVVARYDEDRKAAGTALYRLAECYRKGGKREQAIAAYQRVAREFADESGIAEPSRQQLAAFGVADSREVRPERAAAAEAREQAREVRPEPGLRRDRAPVPKSSLDATQGDLVAMQDRLAQMQKSIQQGEKMVQQGLLAPTAFERLKAEYASAQLRYQQQLEEREARQREAQESRLLTVRMIKSVQAEILLVQARIADIEAKVSVGTASAQDAELLQLRRDLLGLQRKLDELNLQRKLDEVRTSAKRQP